MNLPEFEVFPKIARLSREVIITEKIDGMNAQVFIGEDGEVLAGSRNRWLTIVADNFGFANWVAAHRDDLLKLGHGRHYGEWWGSGVQRGYGLTKGEKRFSLFNTARWSDESVRPSCCHVVPVLYSGDFSTKWIDDVIQDLSQHGSLAAHGFPDPEGIVIFHTASGHLYKKTIKGDEKRKSEAA